MRFGGHETFYVREGWLSKGLEMAVNDPDRFLDVQVADHLGVGRNMAKSIQHWLVATGLCRRIDGTKGRQPRSFSVSDFGRIVHANDPHFTHQATWWFLHINLVCNSQHAATWNWFFNDYPSIRFERGVLTAALEKHEKLRSKKIPSRKTLERDIACFLASYAVEVPYRNKDPEEEIDCPFQDLHLIKHYRGSGYFELNRKKKPIDSEVLIYALNAAKIEGNGRVLDISFHDLTKIPNGPLQTMALTSDGLFEHLAEFSSSGLESAIDISGLAGDRQIRFSRLPLEEIVRQYFDRTEKNDRD